MAFPTPTETSNEPPKKLDPFHPDMPNIPGLGNAPKLPSPAAPADDPGRGKTIAAALGIVLVVGGLGIWWIRKASHGPPDPAPAEVAISPDPNPVPEPPAVLDTPSVASYDGRMQVATSEELSAAWASKKFVFVRPFTRDAINAIVVRLPGGALWAFALQEPNGRCELEYVKDLRVIADRYGYRADHPMVVNPCDKTVYDPLKVGSMGGSTLLRGDIVKGSGSRPPIAIEVERVGKDIIADRIE